MTSSELAEQISNGEIGTAELIEMRDRPESSGALVEALIPILVHADEDVRDTAEHVLRTSGPEIALVLHDVRRRGSGPMRAAALEIVGIDGLDASDQAGVLDAFDLSDAVPVTMRLGESAWSWNRHDWGKQPLQRCRRTYVSPVLDGWTLAFGVTPAEAHLRCSRRRQGAGGASGSAVVRSVRSVPDPLIDPYSSSPTSSQGLVL